MTPCGLRSRRLGRLTTCLTGSIPSFYLLTWMLIQCCISTAPVVYWPVHWPANNLALYVKEPLNTQIHNFDFPGYGESTSYPSEPGLITDALASDRRLPKRRRE